MKSYKILAASVIALSFVGLASAQTTLRITGSTAYRANTVTAIIKLMGGTVSGGIPNMPAGSTAGYVGTNVTSAAAVTLTGTIASTPIVIKTSWAGSVGGVQTVSNAIPVKFIPNQTFASGAGTNNVANPQISGNPSESVVPDVAMSDTYQASTPFNATQLKDTVVGVVPFRWVAIKGTPVAVTNMTTQLAQALYKAGQMSLALFTGANADENKFVYAAGRDPDSGTRLTAFAESGIGVNASVIQYKPTVSGSAVTGYTTYPEQTLNGIFLPEGQSGESSGGTLATLFTNTASASTGYAVTYLGTSDATVAITGGAKELTWHGVKLEDSAPYTSILEGKYTFWGYEHLMYPNSWASSSNPTIVAQRTVANAIANQIATVDAQIKTTDMKVSRATDGGVVSQDY